MNENKAIVDLLAEGLVKQDKLFEKVDTLTENVNTLAEVMRGFREVAERQTNMIGHLISITDEQRGDISAIRHGLGTPGGLYHEVEDLKRRVRDLEEKEE